MNSQISFNPQRPSGNNENPKWFLVSLIALALLILCNGHCFGQIVTANPGEYTILATGNELINSTVKSETKAERNTALLQNAMAGEFTKIKQWEKDYNSYLKTAEGYASTLKACTSLYDDGVRLFINLCNLKKAIAQNPQGIVATASLNNLYIETATELITVYTTLKDAVAKGGNENMLTGAERSKTLWALNDRLDAFNKKLTRLCLSIKIYTMADMWQNVTAGMIDRSNGEIANQAMGRWRRCASLVTP